MQGVTIEETKQWLNRGYKLRETIRILEKAQMRAYDIVTGTTITLSERVQESHGNGTENKLITYADYCRQIDCHKTDLFEILKHINFETWENISQNIGYSYRQILRLHEKALRKVKDVLECHIESVI
ncbi:MAG: hypothetical protein BHW64_04580 [Candidatus Melainabacteria bacterium LEY3_CP_29_8]|nr:MAG: hypothetical protein BHW64_04580 [Candidatus Melainabacteria bacterium LEY3_CP_29_8]